MNTVKGLFNAHLPISHSFTPIAELLEDFFSLDGVSVKKLPTFLLEASNNICSVKKANEILNQVKEDGHTQKER